MPDLLLGGTLAGEVVARRNVLLERDIVGFLSGILDIGLVRHDFPEGKRLGRQKRKKMFGTAEVRTCRFRISRVMEDVGDSVSTSKMEV